MNTVQAKALVLEHKEQIAQLRSLPVQMPDLARVRVGHTAAIVILEHYIRAIEERNFLPETALIYALKDAREYIEDFEETSKHATSRAKSIEVVLALIEKLEGK
jgi:hypothetical protein